jgi:chemotaxis-related protein WspD
MKEERLLDRPIPEGYLDEWTKRVAMPKVEKEQESDSVLIFRIGTEWLSFSSRFVDELTEAGPIHRLPQHRSRTVMGVANVRGQLVVCISLADFLHISTDQSSKYRRMIVLRDGTLRLAIPVHDVSGTQRYYARDVQEITSTHAESRYTTVILPWNNLRVSCLDTAGLLEALRKSLS